jgi:hypothetical protein
MNVNRFFLTAILFLASATPALANDVVGKWFSQTGDQVITIYKAGPEYAAALPATEGHNSYGTFSITLSEFSVAGTHVHFNVSFFQMTNNGPLMTASVYDLDLSPEGQRLIGTQRNSGWLNNTNQISLFLRN